MSEENCQTTWLSLQWTIWEASWSSWQKLLPFLHVHKEFCQIQCHYLMSFGLRTLLKKSINVHIFPGVNRVFITGSNLLRSVAQSSTTECFACEARTVNVNLTFASTSSEYSLLIGSYTSGNYFLLGIQMLR